MPTGKTKTFALVTRLRRKVFLAKGIADDCIEILTVRISDFGGEILGYRMYPYGILFSCRIPPAIDEKHLISAIKKATAQKLQETYPELWKMPSFWTKKYFDGEGTLQENKENAETFFETIPTR